MFEKFTDEARFAVVSAQEAARELQHDYIGTEHILLGLLARPDQPAARALASLGVSADSVRRDVVDRVGTGAKPAGGHIPFTPHAKSTLEHSLRESFALEHSFIGTEHVLLGMLRQPDGLGAQILATLAGDLSRVRAAVLDLISGAPPAEGESGPLPAEAGRRSMVVRVADDRLTLEVADPALVDLARAALTALGDQVDEPDTIPGGLPAAASLAAVWQALVNSLDDIRRRAAPPASG